MAYITPAEVEARLGTEDFISAGDRDADGIPDDAAIQAAIDEAAGYLDLYLSKLVTLPLNDPPPFLKRMNFNGAVYFVAENIGAYTKEYRIRWEDDIKTLQMMVEGKLGMPGLEDDPNYLPSVSFTVDEREYSRLQTRGMGG